MTRLIRDAYVIGIDGGASKTTAILGSADGKMLGRGQGGSANYQNVGTASATQSIKRAVREAQLGAGVGTRKAEVAVVALAGVDSSRDRYVAEQFVRKANIARRTFVVHDSIAYLQSAFPNQPGIIVESGTGCVAAGINSRGSYVRVGGWGAMFDDQGSGYDIGRSALNAAFRALDGRGPQSSLLPAISRRFHVKNRENLPYVIYSAGLTVEKVAHLAHLVSNAAKNDEVARRILRDAGAKLGELACTVAKRLNVDQGHIKIAAVGGVFNAGKHLTKAFKQRVKENCPRAEIIRPDIEPAIGAFSLALRKTRWSRSRTRGKS